MAGLLGIVLPLAVGAAVSPTVLALQLVTLSGATAGLARSWMLAGGCAVALAVLGALVFAVADGTGGSHSPSEAGAVVKLASAALLVAIAVHQLRAPPRERSPDHRGGHELRRAFLLGVALMATNFSSIALFVPAVHAIGTAGVSPPRKALAFALLYAITLAPAFGPPVFVSLSGRWGKAILERTNRLLAEHRRGIGAGLCLTFAALLAGKGLSVLL